MGAPFAPVVVVLEAHQGYPDEVAESFDAVIQLALRYDVKPVLEPGVYSHDWDVLV